LHSGTTSTSQSSSYCSVKTVGEGFVQKKGKRESRPDPRMDMHMITKTLSSGERELEKPSIRGKPKSY
jgi:hypothetical protein